jgi:hypothetical protein
MLGCALLNPTYGTNFRKYSLLECYNLKPDYIENKHEIY